MQTCESGFFHPYLFDPTTHHLARTPIGSLKIEAGSVDWIAQRVNAMSLTRLARTCLKFLQDSVPNLSLTDQNDLIACRHLMVSQFKRSLFYLRRTEGQYSLEFLDAELNKINQASIEVLCALGAIPLWRHTLHDSKSLINQTKADIISCMIPSFYADCPRLATYLRTGLPKINDCRTPYQHMVAINQKLTESGFSLDDREIILSEINNNLSSESFWDTLAGGLWLQCDAGRIEASWTAVSSFFADIQEAMNPSRTS